MDGKIKRRSDVMLFIREGLEKQMAEGPASRFNDGERSFGAAEVLTEIEKEPHTELGDRFYKAAEFIYDTIIL